MPKCLEMLNIARAIYWPLYSTMTTTWPNEYGDIVSIHQPPSTPPPPGLFQGWAIISATGHIGFKMLTGGPGVTGNLPTSTTRNSVCWHKMFCYFIPSHRNNSHAYEYDSLCTWLILLHETLPLGSQLKNVWWEYHFGFLNLSFL